MRVLALNPWHGGSHRAFLEGWIAHSRHEFTPVTLPAHRWKWRMRHAAVSFAQEVGRLAARGAEWDALLCTDMLNLAEFRGLCPTAVHRLPTAVYFHENQLAYPSRSEHDPPERDLHFAFTNFTTALAADAVWFNSNWHRQTFLASLRDWLHHMPDFDENGALDQIRARSSVQRPGIEVPIASIRQTARSPLHIVWAARWEYDKDPETFFTAIRQLVEQDVPFNISVLGESFRDAPDCFENSRHWLGDRVLNWGYLESRAAYRQVLSQADVFVSTARHEFFGIAAAEAIASGCVPLLPDRLAYPELVGSDPQYLYDGTSEELATRLRQLADTPNNLAELYEHCTTLKTQIAQLDWRIRADDLDDALHTVAARPTDGLDRG